MTSPTGSGSAAIVRTPAAIAAIRSGVSVSRSSSALESPGLLARLQIAGVGLEDLVGAGDQRRGNRLQRRVLDRRGSGRELARGELGGGADLGNGQCGGGHRHKG